MIWKRHVICLICLFNKFVNGSIFCEISFFEDFTLEDTSLTNDPKKSKKMSMRQIRPYNSTYGKGNGKQKLNLNKFISEL